MSIFEWLYNTGAAEYIRASLWGYPIALTVHGVGMAIVVGLLVVVDLRLLGAFRSMPIQGLSKLWGWAVFGFVINLVSGLLLFIGDAVNYVTNWAFLAKIGMIIIGVALAFVVKAAPEFRQSDSLSPDAVAGARGRVLAVFSLAAWLLAIVFGRLVGYVL